MSEGLADGGLARDAFPALARVHNGHPVAYFDGPGGTQVPRAVADAVADYLLHHNATARWATPTSRETDAVIAGARAAMADLLGAPPEEVAFGQNMTTLAFHLSRALGRALPAGPGAGWCCGPRACTPTRARSTGRTSPRSWARARAWSRSTPPATR